MRILETTKIKKKFGKYKAAVVYPNGFKAGMSNIGYQSVLFYIEKSGLFTVSRYFKEINCHGQNPRHPQASPWSDFVSPASSTGIARGLRGSKIKNPDSRLGLRSFDFIFFSVSAECDFPNVEKMLIDENIPVKPEERENFPIIIAGGSAVWNAPDALKNTADVCILADAPVFIDDFKKILSGLKQDGKKEIKNKLSRLPYAYHNHSEKIPQIHAADINKFPLFTHYAGNYAFNNMFLILAQRGCSFKCPFCFLQASVPAVQTLTIETIKEIINKYLPSEMKKIGIVAGGWKNIDYLIELSEFLLKRNLSVSLSSLRAENLSLEMKELIKKIKQKTLTVAPETGSLILKKKINKNLKKEFILEKLADISSYGVTSVRFYYIYGLPGETSKTIDETLEEIKYFRENLKKVNLFFSVNPFVPKRLTAFENFKFDIKKMRTFEKYFKRKLKEMKTYNVKFEGLKGAYFQYKTLEKSRVL